jgi:integrase
MSAKPTTYQDLLDIQERLVQQGALKAQTAANRASTLRAFLKLNKLEVDDPVGIEFRAAFLSHMEAFVAKLRADSKSQRNITNSMAALRPWRKLVVTLDTDRAIAGDNLAPFNQAVKSLLKEQPVDPLVRQLGIPRYMMYGWLKGKKPRLSNVKHIHRLEAYFGVPHGELAVLAGFAGNQHVQPTIGVPVEVDYRNSLAARTSDHYFFKPEPTSPLRAQWKDFLVYKTDEQPELARTEKGIWRLAPFEFNKESPATWSQFLDGVEVPSARMGWARVAGYLGWLAIPIEEGGGGVPAQQLHTLAWLAVRDKVNAFLRWVVKRSGGCHTGSYFEFCAFGKNVLRLATGYLYQQPELLATLPAEYRGDWEKMCSRTFDLLQASSARHHKSRQQGRDPKAPMQHILEAENPLDFVADMVQRLRADRPIGNSPVREAVWARDLALVKLVVSNPLRLRNLATLTWRPDNTGQLYQRSDGSWWIRIDKRNFKNTRGFAGEHTYDSPVQESVWTDLERYLKTFRPRLLRCQTDFVFVAGRHGSKPRPPDAPWTGLSGRLDELTSKYLFRCPGIGAHAFRHLVATAIIKASNYSDFKTAALVLNDKLSTVERHYAHLQSADGANRMSELLGATLNRM